MRPANFITALGRGSLSLGLLCALGSMHAGAAPDGDSETSLPIPQSGSISHEGGRQHHNNGEATLRTITRSPPRPEQTSMTAIPPSEPQVHLARPTGTPGAPSGAGNEHVLDLRDVVGPLPQPDEPTPATVAPPVVTEAPNLADADPDGDTTGTALAHEEEGIITGIDPNGKTWRFRQTTYYSCVTRGATYTHCGWHRPLLEAGAGRLGGAGDGMGIAARAGVAAGLVAVVLGR